MSRNRLRRVRVHAAILAGFTVLAIGFTYPLVLHLSTHIPYHQDVGEVGGDHWTFLWALGFVERLLFESKQWSLETDAIFYPRGVDLTYPFMFVIGLQLALSVPFVHLLGVVPTYNLFLLVSFILTAYTTFLLVRYLTHDDAASIIAGLIFAFAPYHLARFLGHFNLATSGMWLPLYILLYIRALNEGGVRYLLLAPFILVLTLTTNAYYGVFLGVFSVIYLVYYWASHTGAGVSRPLITRLLAMGGIAAILVLPVVWFIVNHEFGDTEVYPGMEEVWRWGADLLAFFLPSRHHTLWGDLVKPIYDRFTGNNTEQTVSLGYTLLALATLAVWWGRPQATRLWVISALIFFVLSLGPYLHIMGQYELGLKGVTLALPLPDYLLYYGVPVLRTMRVASRFSIMLMLALVVLAGYGITYLLARLGRRAWAAPICLSLIVAAVALEYVIAPVHLVDARTPAIYNRIGRAEPEGGTLLDVPLRWTHFRYEYYQISHRKRLLLGQAPRLSLSLIATYADSVPFMKLFKNPEVIGEYEDTSPNQRDILRFIEFFDLSWIVIHKRHLAPEVFNRLLPFLRRHFPIAQEVEGDHTIALQIARDAANVEVLVETEGYFFDFGSTVPQYFLTEGYSIPERWGELTVVWSEGKASDLWVYFPRLEDFTMELRLLPFTFPDSPPQGVTMVVNGKPLGELTVAMPAWHSYTVRIPPTHLRPGINTFRFLYRYAVSPASVIPGAQDPRRLGVAFDFVRFRSD